MKTFKQFNTESTAEYAKSLAKIAHDKKLKSLSKKDRETLKKIADLMSKEEKTVKEFKHTMTFYDVKSAAAAEKKLKKYKLKGKSSSTGGKYTIDVDGKFTDVEKWMDSL